MTPISKAAPTGHSSLDFLKLLSAITYVMHKPREPASAGNPFSPRNETSTAEEMRAYALKSRSDGNKIKSPTSSSRSGKRHFLKLGPAETAKE